MDVLHDNDVVIHVASKIMVVIVCQGLHDLASLPPKSPCVTRCSFLTNYYAVSGA